MAPLEAIAERTRRDPFFLGWLLDRYARAEQLDDPGLASALGCRPDQLTHLRLCRAPRESAGDFREDVHRIAAVFALEPGRLAAVVRRAAVLLRLEAPSGAADAPLSLMAARDADERNAR